MRYISPSQALPESPVKKSIVFTYSQIGTSQVKSQPKTKEDTKSPKKSLTSSAAGLAAASNKKSEGKGIETIPSASKKIDSTPLIPNPKSSKADPV